jgi:hypothetical protein
VIPSAALRTRGAFAEWQRRAALDDEADFVRYQLRQGRTGPFDLGWHTAIGRPLPDDIARAQAKFAAGAGVATEKCRSCGAAILWQVSRQGRPMPLDPPVLELVVYDPAEADPAVHKNPLETVFTQAGETVRGWHVGADVRPELPRVRGRISHFATCPNAHAHRRQAPPSSAEESP